MSTAGSRVAGKVAIITGASKGIGAQIAKQLALEGASVVVNYSSSKNEADKVVADIQANGGKSVAIQADLSRPEEIRKLFAEAKQKFGRLDILVNNAGVYDFKPLEEVTTDHFHRQFNLNVLGLILATQEATKYFSKTGGSVINIGSLAGRTAIATGSVYAATKAAVESITRSLGAELGPRGIRVNAVNPGMVETEGLHAVGFSQSDFRKMIESQTPLGRIGQVDDIAPAVVFLASEESKWMTGESIFVSGGYR